MRAHQEARRYMKEVVLSTMISPDPFPRTTTITDQEKYQEAISEAREMDTSEKRKPPR